MADQKEESNDNTVKDRVLKMSTRNFYVSNCPEKIFIRFVEYAQRETADNYSMAIKQLLDVASVDAKTAMLYERIVALEQRVVELEQSHVTSREVSKEESKRKNIPTMGGR